MRGCRGGADWRLCGLRGNSPLSLVDESPASARSCNIGAVNRAMAVCTAIGNWQPGPVVVACMALQAQRRLADREEIGVRRSMKGVATQTIFRHWRMLVGKRSAILCVAAQTKFVHVSRSLSGLRATDRGGRTPPLERARHRAPRESRALVFRPGAIYSGPLL